MATNVVKSLKDASIVLSDYQGGTEKITLDLEDGDLSFTLPDTHEHVADRGAPGSIIDGAFQPIDWSMTLQAKSWIGSVSPIEVFTCTAGGSWDFSLMDTATGDYSALTLASGADTLATSGVSVFQMVVTITDPGDDSTETLYFANCTASVTFNEGMPSKISASGKCYMTPGAFMSNIVAA